MGAESKAADFGITIEVFVFRGDAKLQCTGQSMIRRTSQPDDRFRHRKCTIGKAVLPRSHEPAQMLTRRYQQSCMRQGVGLCLSTNENTIRDP